MSPPSPLTRFAPAPTGYLHLGHVANAIFVWGIGRARGAKVLLRIEDHDRGRCRPEYEAALLEDLDWLGFTPDLGSIARLRAGPSDFRQSDRGEVYLAALEELGARQQVYGCDCSRRDLTPSPPLRPGEGEPEEPVETRYPGRCRNRGLEAGPGRGLRVVLPPREVHFTDGRLGDQVQCPSEQCGDLLIRDRLGNWTYQFAVTVDDFRQGVDLVIRGEDLLPSTGRQIQLAAMLGRVEAAQWFHHPLILKPSGEKLSKANRDTAIRELREQGIGPTEVLGLAAHGVGLIDDARPVGVAEIADWFQV